MIKKIIDNISSLPSSLRGAPFWAWNSTLTPSRLREQIRMMKAMGFGGFYMHSRTGLDTPYLSGEWFECISSCVDEAEKLGMEAWLYDEDRWPSGAAGGIVTADDRFKMRKLRYCKGEAPEPDKSIVRFALKTDGNKLLSSRRLRKGEMPDGTDGELFSFYWEYMERSSWYNGETYLDTLNPEAVAKFVEVTHREYAARYQDKFGSIIPGIFTDEPCYIHGDVALAMPWTGRIPEEFEKSFNYDLLDFLPELFFEISLPLSRARHDYYALITRLFVEAFCGTIGRWCDEHDIKMTGHTLAEDYLSSQLLYCGAAMRFYEHMQLPGIDVLTERWNVFNTAKQCTSVARQLGKERVLTESYACTGWDFPLFGHKALCDWQFAMGVNQRCLHLTWYSMEAEGKRDYPASISSHSPWYRQYPVVEDYFARLSAVLVPGDEIRDLLVIHPVNSHWAMMVKDIPVTEAEKARRQIKPGTKAMDGFYSEKLNHFGTAHSLLTNLLLAENIDFDFGDEDIISRYGSVSADGKFTVGKAEYPMVLLPEMTTLRSTTLKLLESFPGKVFYLGEAPRFVDAVPSDAALKLYEKFIPVTMENAAELITSGFRRVSIALPGGEQAQPVLYRLAQDEDGYTFFICNTSMPFSAEIKDAPRVCERTIACPELSVSIAVPEKGGIFELDLLTGKFSAVDYLYRDGAYRFDTSLDVLQSRVYLISAAEINALPPQKKLSFQPGKPLPDVPMEYHLEENNTFVFDHAAWRVNGGEWQEEEYILLLDDHLRQMLGSPARGGRMAQPWHQDKARKWPEAALELEYRFECREVPQEDCILYLEHPELYRFELNDEVLPIRYRGYWMDEVIRGIEIPCAMLRTGKNILKLRTQYHCGQRGLECMYLAGKFGVSTASVITALPEKLRCGDWCEQNLANYAGNVTCVTELDVKKPSVLNFRQWRGSLLGVRINGQENILLPWPPYQVELPVGKCRVEITVYGHRRNALGPFYLDEKWPVRTGPHQYKVYEHPERQLVPFGLLEMPEIKEIL